MDRIDQILQEAFHPTEKPKSTMTDKEKSIILFKYFIEFLQIWGQENYGENSEIDWCKALGECQRFHLFDFNEKLEEVVFSETDEEFRDLAFKWVENKVLEGWPIWRMFKLSPWLLEKLEEQHSRDQIDLEFNNYKTYKCYRCKHFKDNAGWFKDTFDGPKYVSVDDQLPPDGKINWRVECLKRNELLNGRPKHSSFGHHQFEYEKFNTCYRDWTLDPKELSDCPYYEDGGMDWPTYVLHTFGIKIKD